MDSLALFGLLAVSAMLVFYALEDRPGVRRQLLPHLLHSSTTGQVCHERECELAACYLGRTGLVFAPK
jgi:hypothetical protein